MKLSELVNEWHEAGRAEFEERCNPLIYDEYDKKYIREKTKWINLDAGRDAGCRGVFMIRKSDLAVFRIKAYGVPHLQKFIGYADTLTGAELKSKEEY